MGKRNKPTLQLTPKIEQEIANFHDLKLAKVPENAFKSQLAAYLKRIDPRITLRQLDIWKKISPWIVDVSGTREQQLVHNVGESTRQLRSSTRARSNASVASAGSSKSILTWRRPRIRVPPNATKRMVGMKTRLQSRILERDAVRRREPEVITVSDDTSSGHSSSSRSTTSGSGSSFDPISSCPCGGLGNEDIDVVMEIDHSEDGGEEDADAEDNAIPDANANAEVSVPPQSLVVPVPVAPQEALVVADTNANPRRGFLTGEEVFDFFQNTLLPMTNSSSTTETRVIRSRSCPLENTVHGQLQREMENQDEGDKDGQINGGINQQIMSFPPSLALPPFATAFPMTPVNSFLPIVPEPPPLSPSVSFASALQILANRVGQHSSTFLPRTESGRQEQSSQPKNNENASNSKGNNGPKNLDLEKFSNILSSLQNILNVFLDTRRTIKGCGRRVRNREAKLLKNLCWAYVQELATLVRRINCDEETLRAAARVKQEVEIEVIEIDEDDDNENI